MLRTLLKFDQETSRSYKAITAAFATLASDDSISGGSLTFKNSDEPDAELGMYKFVGEFALADRDRPLVPLLEIAPAYLKLDQVIPGEACLEVEGRTIGVGTGVQINFCDQNLQIIPRLKVDYS